MKNVTMKEILAPKMSIFEWLESNPRFQPKDLMNYFLSEGYSRQEAQKRTVEVMSNDLIRNINGEYYYALAGVTGV